MRHKTRKKRVLCKVYFLEDFGISLSSLPFNALTGLLLGSIHGVIAMLLVSILIMEHHPNSKYHNRGPATGLAQLGAHMVYGTIVGSVASLLR